MEPAECPFGINCAPEPFASISVVCNCIALVVALHLVDLQMGGTCHVVSVDTLYKWIKLHDFIPNISIDTFNS